MTEVSYMIVQINGTPDDRENEKTVDYLMDQVTRADKFGDVQVGAVHLLQGHELYEDAKKLINWFSSDTPGSVKLVAEPDKVFITVREYISDAHTRSIELEIPGEGVEYFESSESGSDYRIGGMYSEVSSIVNDYKFEAERLGREVVVDWRIEVRE